MTKYMKNHEAYINEKIDSNAITHEILDYHHTQILYLRHERLIHLLVTCLVSVVFIIILAILVLNPSIIVSVLTLILLVLDAFYLAHYYYLENTVQRWYLIEITLLSSLTNLGLRQNTF